MDKEEIIQEIDELIKRSELHFSTYHLQKAEELIKEAVFKSKEYGITEKQIESLDTLAYYHVKEIGNVELARLCYNECIRLIKKANGSRRELAYVYSRLGGTYYFNNWHMLIYCYNQSLDYYSFEDDYINHSRIYCDLGKAYKSLSNNGLAEKSYLKALDIRIKAQPNYKTELPWENILGELSEIYLMMGNENKYVQYARRREQASKDIKGE